MAFQKFLVILDGIYIDRTQSADIIFDLSCLFLHLGKVCQFFFSIRKSIVRSNLVLFPHIGDTLFSALFQLLHLALQTVAFFIQKTDLAGKLVALFKEFLMLRISAFFFFLQILQLFLCLLFADNRFLCLFLQICDGLLFFLHLFTAVRKRFIDVVFLSLKRCHL